MGLNISGLFGGSKERPVKLPEQRSGSSLEVARRAHNQELFDAMASIPLERLPQRSAIGRVQVSRVRFDK